ncbi:hypothetical protein [Salibaculum sp.]|uniref:hypothetical protein n=1 Tax=Salibaculum sp. TaxID=2855480 RepID=UPI002B47B9DE|nr:hypothetical protein [Salibaculum sp.]HKL68990.1 hypothetical protein [Salibaculum sp.]
MRRVPYRLLAHSGRSVWRPASAKRQGNDFCEAFIFCYSMSRYSIYLEKKLQREHR